MFVAAHLPTDDDHSIVENRSKFINNKNCFIGVNLSTLVKNKFDSEQNFSGIFEVVGILIPFKAQCQQYNFFGNVSLKFPVCMLYNVPSHTT